MKFLAAGLVLVASLCATPSIAADMADYTDKTTFNVGGGYDYLSTGQQSMGGFAAHVGWHGVELGYRDVSGNSSSGKGPTLDYVLQWHYYIVTAGMTYMSTSVPGAKSDDLNWRVGGGLKFGAFRALLRYEPFHHQNGLTASVGLDVDF